MTTSATLHPLATSEPWNLVATAYAGEALQHFEVFAREALRLAELRPAARIVDVACGPGTVSVAAALGGARADCIDIAEGMLAELARRAAAAGVTGAIAAHLGDAQKLPFESGVYDAAFSMFGVMFVPDRHAAFEEMRRVLKPGGRAIVSSWVPFVGPFGELMNAVAELVPGLPLGGKLPLGSPDELRAELGSAGFRDIRVETVTYEMKAPSFDAFWDSIQRTNAPLVLLKSRLGDRWTALAPKIRERIRAALGDGPVVLGRGAYLGIGVA